MLSKVIFINFLTEMEFIDIFLNVFEIEYINEILFHLKIKK
jgi:hypothetical protein